MSTYKWHDLGGREAKSSQLRFAKENELVFATDWASTELGPINSWPPEVLSHVWTNVLNSTFPSALLLGPELRLVYNKAYSVVIGEHNHPSAMGKPVFSAFPEVETQLKSLFTRILEHRDCFFLQTLLVPFIIDGYREEHYFDLNYSPLAILVDPATTLKDQSAHQASIVGIQATMMETTRHVLSQRRLAVLSELAHIDAVKTHKDIAKQCLSIIANNKMDFPASAIYLCGAPGVLTLEASLGLDPATSITLPHTVEESAIDGNAADEISRQIFSALKSRKTHTMEKLTDKEGKVFSTEVEKHACSRAHFIPLVSASKAEVHGILLVCHNPLASEVNKEYLTFLGSTASAISNSIGTSKTLAEGLQRAEEQRRLNEAKTTFFNNISHEFRTPLTLMLGPLEDLLENSERSKLASDVHVQLGFVYRNACRLLRLVNQLLDFSRVEAGRQRASFLPVDLASLTSDLAGVFRAALEKANLEFAVECPPLAQPVYVDADMWERIVLNLLSNAHKFTPRGRITVKQKNSRDKTGVILQVSDTGCGIPETELPRVFERFHQVKMGESRSHEGSGIGLALVSELVRLHGGKIQVESTVNVGTTFFVSLPYGSAHLPSADVVDTNVVADPAQARAKTRQTKYAWMLEQDAPKLEDQAAAHVTPHAAVPIADKGEVLVVDDNPDMQQYIARILMTGGFTTTAARDGEEALLVLSADTKDRIDLVLSDVMMPRLDGFGLLRRMRASLETRDLPIIFLSARAGDEAKVEGIEAGADDYLVKPFSAKELLARVRGKVQTRRLQQQVIEQQRELRQVAEQMNAAKDRFLAVLSHELRTPLTPALLLAEEMHADMTNSLVLRENCGTIMRNILLEVQLIDDLLDIAKIAQQKFRIQLRALSAHALLQQALTLVQQSIDQKEQRVVLDLQAMNDVVMADATRLQQIFWNLIKNATKFTPNRGVITLRTSNTLDPATTRQVLCVQVQDTGIGIEPELLTIIFTAFEQGKESITRLFGGLGLGLSIAASLAKMHNGELKAISEGKNKGACFTLTLPTTIGSPKWLPLQPSTSASAPMEPMHLLLVEDNAATLSILSRALAKMGHTVETASNVSEATVKAEADSAAPFDALVSDLSMPDGSGLSLPAIVRKRQPKALAIAISGNGSADDKARSLEAGFAVHLTKPIRIAELKDALIAGKQL